MSLARTTRPSPSGFPSYIREEVLDSQLSELLTQYVLPRDWVDGLNRMTDKDEKDTSQIAAASVQDMRARIGSLEAKIASLTDLFIEQDIDRGEYLERKRELMSEKRSLQEQSLLLERDAAVWLEPMREWINQAQALGEIANSKDSPSKKSSLQKVFGSNLTLHAREARVESPRINGFGSYRQNRKSPFLEIFKVWCAGKDSNLRRPKPHRLQRCSIDHSDTDALGFHCCVSPYALCVCGTDLTKEAINISSSG